MMPEAARQASAGAVRQEGGDNIAENVRRESRLSVSITDAPRSELFFEVPYTTTGSQSDVALGSASTVRYAGTAVATFYGIAAGTNGQVVVLHNSSNYTLTLSNQSSSDATAASRIITGIGSDLSVTSNSSVILQYDTSASRWRVIGGTAISNGTGGTVWQMIASTDIGSAVTSYTFSGLTGDTDIEYQTVAKIVAGSGSGTSYYVLPNADTTTSNYGNELIYGAGGSPAAGGATSAAGLYGGYTSGSGQIDMLTGLLYAKTGQARVFNSYVTQGVTGTTVAVAVGASSVWTNTATQITSLQILSSSASGLGVGTHLEVWAQRTIAGSTASGNVTSSTAGQIAYYQSTGTTVIGTSTITAGTWNGSAIGVAYGGTGASSAGITAFNNITGYTASGATGTTSTNLVFSASPTLTGTITAAAVTLSGALNFGDTNWGVRQSNAAGQYFTDVFGAFGANSGGGFRVVNKLGGTESVKMIVDYNGTGNVGIGTTAPTSNLTVINSAGGGYNGPTSGTWATRVINASNNSGQDGLSVQNAWANTNSIIFEAAKGWNGLAVGYYPVFSIDGLGNISWIGGNGANTGNVQAYFQNSTGNVGIGSTVPGYKLDVNGTLGVTGALSLPTAAVAPSTMGVFNSAGTVLNFVGGSTGTNFNNLANNATLVTILNGGNVGIQTTSPQAALSLGAATPGTGEATAHGLLLINGGGDLTAANGIELKGAASGSGYGWKQVAYDTGSGIDLLFGTRQNSASWTEKVRLDHSGNVGIGNSSPGYKLDVTGTGNVSGTLRTGGDLTWGGAIGTLTNDGTNAYMQSASGGALILRTNGGTERMRIASGGNVGIGNTNPAYTLDVTGEIHANGWLRTDGTQGWYSQTYGGGWYMTDTSWLRAYGGKGIYTSSTIQADTDLRTVYLCDTAGANCSTPAAIKAATGTAPSFSVNNGASTQTVAAATWTAMSFSTAVFDTTSGWSVANSKYTPNVAGKYIFTGTVQCNTAPTACYSGIQKNGNYSPPAAV